MELASALLAVVALAGALFILIARVFAVDTGVGRFAAKVSEQRLAISAAIGVYATLASLYFSEVLHYEPCRLCWFQRTMMYPIGVIGVVAWIRSDRSSRWYFIALSAIGLVISGWHNLVELNPTLDSDSCSIVAPCSIVYFRSLHFFSLATMALCGFFAVLVFNAVRFPVSATEPSE